MDDGGQHAVTRRTVLPQQFFCSADDRTKIRLVRNYAMLDNFCKSRTQFVKWKCSKDLWVYDDCGGSMKNTHQILPGGGIDGCFSTDGGVHHCHQTGGYLDHWNTPHESGGDEPSEVPNHPAAQCDHRRVPSEAADQHLIGQAAPGIPGFIGLTGGDGQDIDLIPAEPFLDLAGVNGADVGVGDYSVAMGGADLFGNRCHMRDQAGCYPDRRSAERELPMCWGRRHWRSASYQVTSPAPVRTLASRARVNSRSESRFR